jgi:hypothetical protein
MSKLKAFVIVLFLARGAQAAPPVLVAEGQSEIKIYCALQPGGDVERYYSRTTLVHLSVFRNDDGDVSFRWDLKAIRFGQAPECDLMTSVGATGKVAEAPALSWAGGAGFGFASDLSQAHVHSIKVIQAIDAHGNVELAAAPDESAGGSVEIRLLPPAR